MATTIVRESQALQDAGGDPKQLARSVGLHYVTDAMPGIQRRLAGRHFSYIGRDGKPTRAAEELRRIRSLVIPPAWTDVWICPRADGHLQATGRDARGRKQYRYHPRWREVRDEAKYHHMVAFGEALSVIRKRVDEDLAKPGLPREKVLATVVRLLETTLIRVGNEEYARTNNSYGLTTMRSRHAEISGSLVTFSFRGKSNQEHHVSIRDRRLARIVKRCQELPGQELFQYIDDDGELRRIDSGDVNDYLRETTGQDFTAKDFRTWVGTVLAAYALQEFESFDSAAQAKKNVVRAIEAVSGRLGNTPAVCRKCYVHPEVINAYVDGTLAQILQQRVEQELAESLAGLEPEETAVLALLRNRLADETASTT